MKLYLKGARLNYVLSLFTAQIAKGSTKAKFSISAIIESTTQAFAGEAKPDSATGKAAGYKWGDPKEEFSKAIVAVATEKWGPKAMEVIGQLKAQDRLCLHDGAKKGATPGYAGNLYVNASNDIAPGVKHKQTGAQLTGTSGVIYSGCYGDVVLDVWAQDPKSNPEWGKRVNASLLAVEFSHDGERLAGGAVASEDDYAAIPEGAQKEAAKSGDGAASIF